MILILLAIKDQLQREYPATKKQREAPDLYDERIDKLYKKEGSFSIAYLNRLVDTKEHITINDTIYKQLGSYCREEGKGKDDFFSKLMVLIVLYRIFSLGNMAK